MADDNGMLEPEKFRAWQDRGKADMVNHPPHYTKGKIEVIDFIEDQEFDYHAGQVIKYMCRYRHKGSPVEDLAKARWYLTRLLDRVTKQENDLQETV